MKYFGMYDFKIKRIIRRNTTENMIMWYFSMIVLGIVLGAIILTYS